MLLYSFVSRTESCFRPISYKGNEYIYHLIRGAGRLELFNLIICQSWARSFWPP